MKQGENDGVQVYGVKGYPLIGGYTHLYPKTRTFAQGGIYPKNPPRIPHYPEH